MCAIRTKDYGSVVDEDFRRAVDRGEQRRVAEHERDERDERDRGRRASHP